MDKKKFLEHEEYTYIEQLKALSKDEIIEREIERRKRIWPRLAISVLMLFLFIIGTVFGYSLTEYILCSDYEYIKESRENWKGAMHSTSEYVCSLDNEGFFNAQLFAPGNNVMIECSSHNIQIKDGKRE